MFEVLVSSHVPIASTRYQEHREPPQGAFGAVIAVGPGAMDLWRGVELVRSVMFWEQRISACVFLDNAPQPRGLTELALLPSGCQVCAIHLPAKMGKGGWLKGQGSWLGTLTAGILHAMAWILDRTDAGFVVRLDADALVIAPFAARIQQYLDKVTDAGVVGALGISSNPANRSRQDLTLESRLVSARRRWPSSVNPIAVRDGYVDLETFGRVALVYLKAFDKIRPHLDAAVENGYWANEYCQGGACVVSRRMLRAMNKAGYLDNPGEWDGLPFPDDVVLAMYARAVGLRICDYSAEDEPFGVQHQGLPYPPEELVTRGHSLIHSVRNSSIPEAQIRQYFEARRAAVMMSAAATTSPRERVDDLS